MYELFLKINLRIILELFIIFASLISLWTLCRSHLINCHSFIREYIGKTLNFAQICPKSFFLIKNIVKHCFVVYNSDVLRALNTKFDQKKCIIKKEGIMNTGCCVWLSPLVEIFSIFGKTE